MKTTILLRRVEIDDNTRKIIEKKIAKLDKFFGDEEEALVTLRKVKDTEILELTIRASGMIFRSEVKSESFCHAIDVAVDIIERQIRRNKTRLERRLRDTAFDRSKENNTVELEEEHGAQVRTKQFDLKPMTVDEAILQMNLLEHNFFVFENQDTEKICVAYKRNDGDYGLIVTDK